MPATAASRASSSRTPAAGSMSAARSRQRARSWKSWGLPRLKRPHWPELSTSAGRGGRRSRTGREPIGGERAVRQSMPHLALAQERNTEIAPHRQLLAVGAELHERVVDGAVARIENRSALVGKTIAS